VTPAPTILHLDLDAFFAQAEELDDPSLAGKPVIVGGERRPDGTVGRGVVSTANYAARASGVHSAMPMARAVRLCPHAEYRRPRFDRYKQLSRRVFEVCEGFTPSVDRVGIDEGYLDVAGLERWTDLRAGSEGPPGSVDPVAWSAWPWPARLAAMLKAAVRDSTGLTCSIGVAPTRFLAKIASDLDKPDGLTVVTADRAPAFIASLPIDRLRGVGPVAARRLRERGYRTGEDLVRDSREHVASILGDFGVSLWDAAHAIETPRGARHERRSISAETTFPEDVGDRERLIATLASLTEKVCYRLRAEGLRAGTVSIKLRRHDFSTVTRDRSLGDHSAGSIGCTDHEADALPVATALLARELEARPPGSSPVRLIGVKLSELSATAQRQLRLGETEAVERQARLASVTDAIRDKHGLGAIHSALAQPARRPRPGADRGRGPG
jgi:DNA polymerase-4